MLKSGKFVLHMMHVQVKIQIRPKTYNWFVSGPRLIYLPRFHKNPSMKSENLWIWLTPVGRGKNARAAWRRHEIEIKTLNLNYDRQSIHNVIWARQQYRFFRMAVQWTASTPGIRGAVRTGNHRSFKFGDHVTCDARQNFRTLKVNVKQFIGNKSVTSR